MDPITNCVMDAILYRNRQLTREEFAHRLLHLAHQLIGDGHSPYRVLLRLGQIDAQAGCPIVNVLAVLRQVPGQENFDPVQGWHEEYKDPPSPTAELLGPDSDIPWGDR
jgi:hypothetical protein